MTLLSMVSAEMALSQLNPSYNIGDEFETSIKISKAQVTSGFLLVDFICEGSLNSSNQLQIYKAPLTLSASEQHTLTISTKLNPSIIEDKKGLCYITAKYDGESVNSAKFTLSNSIIISPVLRGTFFNPEQEVIVSGIAEKQNGQLLDGYLELTIADMGISTISEVVAGNFEIAFNLPPNTSPGEHEIKLKAYEKLEDDSIINEGESTATFFVRQIAREIDVALEKSNILPGEELKFMALLYDQVDAEFSGEIVVHINSDNGTAQEEFIVKSNEGQAYQLQTNAVPGYWEIQISFNELSTKKAFYVESLEKLSYTLLNSSLIIKNIGNAPYNKPIEISIGGTREVLKLSLPVGGEKMLYLSAPEGSYNISVSDNVGVASVGTTFLTGRAISVSDSELFSSGAFSLFLIIILVLLIILTAIIYFRYRIKNRNGLAGMKTDNYKSLTAPNVVSSPFISKSTNIEDGKRESCSVVSLNIKNLSSFQQNSDAKSILDSVLMEAKSKKAKVYVEGNHHLIIFAPSLTQIQDSLLTAIGIARTLKSSIDEYNKNHMQRISYGLGINTGDLIVEFKDGTSRFSSLNNTIKRAKDISDYSEKELLISKEVHDKSVGKVRSEKHEKLSNIWRLAELSSSYKSAEFVNKFNQKKD
jgi:hypothetical protein